MGRAVRLDSDAVVGRLTSNCGRHYCGSGGVFTKEAPLTAIGDATWAQLSASRLLCGLPIVTAKGLVPVDAILWIEFWVLVHLFLGLDDL